MAPEQVQRAAELTRKAGCWLVMDNTYEAFRYSGTPVLLPRADNVLHIFSFSKVRFMDKYHVHTPAIGRPAVAETRGHGYCQLVTQNVSAHRACISVPSACRGPSKTRLEYAEHTPERACMYMTETGECFELEVGVWRFIVS